MANISVKLEAQLPKGLVRILREIGEIADNRGERAYLVGGVVRDIILERPNRDLDVVIEGKAISLAQQLAKTKAWSIKKHPRFGTARLSWEDFSLDLVTARSETYAQPGALPTVETGTIWDDLSRRDFSINSLAVHLNPDSFGELLDPHGGQVDLQQKLIRVLHSGSFSDDPTRILRALRYEQRLVFQLEQATERLVLKHLDTLDTVTGERLWQEIELVLKEEQPEKVLKRGDELGLLLKLHPALTSDEWLMKPFSRVRGITDKSISKPAVYLILMTYQLSADETEDFATRLKTPGWAIRLLRDSIKFKESISSVEAPDLRPSEIHRILRVHLIETIQAVAIASGSHIIQQRLELYLDRLRYIKPHLNGDDLHSMGIKPGKKMGHILRALQDARLDESVITREDEEALVHSLS